MRDQEALTVDGFEDCAIGLVERFGTSPIYCYDKTKMIEKIIKQDGMTIEEANEHFDFNIIGAWVGEGTPCFLTPTKF